MRSRSALCLAALALLTLPACQPAPAALSPADVEAVRSVSEQFRQHVLAGDWDALTQLYTEDAILMPPNQDILRGREAMREMWASFPPVTDATVIDDSIEGVGDLAYVRGRYTMTLMLESAVVDSGKYLDIRRRQPDGTWKITVDIFNSSVPLPGMP